MMIRRYTSVLFALTVVYAHANESCLVEQQNGNTYLTTTHKQLEIDSANYSLSALKLSNYCMFYGNNNETKGKVRFYNKQTAELYETSNFVDAKQSPDGQYVVVVSGVQKGLVTTIATLDQNGLKKFGRRFSQAFGADFFRLNFSADSQYLNFYSVEEFSIEYSSLNLNSGDLRENIAAGQDYIKALQSSAETKDDYFAFFEPVSPTEYAATTSNNYLGYYQDGKAVWTQKLEGEQGLSRLLAVGKTDVVVINQQGGIDLYRKTDGVKFNALNSTGNHFNMAELNLLSSHFVDDHQLLLSYRTTSITKPQHLLINLATKSASKI
jgi:hypothetical protein